MVREQGMRQTKIPAFTGAHTQMDGWGDGGMGGMGGWVDGWPVLGWVGDCISSTQISKLLLCAKQCEGMGGAMEVITSVHS